MFGHLKAEDFVNLMEGGEPAPKHRTHLESCANCRATWESVQSVHAEMSSEMNSMDVEIPEPDWVEFRSSLRDRLLSRSIKRESAVLRWTGWSIRPAAAWALSAVLVIGLTVTLLWKTAGHPASQPAPSASTVESLAPAEPAADMIGAVPERALFDEILQLGDEQQEQLRQLLESAPRGSQYQQ